MGKGENMKLSELVNEVNTEQELSQLCDELCKQLTHAMHTRWKHSRDKTHFTYKVGQKYIKIISNDRDGLNTSVWGFINKSNSNFKEGDILKAAGWRAPALNKARGNLFDGYDINPNSMRIYGPDYLR